MVRGLDIFKKYFEQYPENYVIIGGTACDIIIDEAGFIPRATKDIDIILIIEALFRNLYNSFGNLSKTVIMVTRKRVMMKGSIIGLKNRRTQTFRFR